MNKGDRSPNSMVRNLFLEDAAVTLYDAARPYFHPLVFTHLSRLLPSSPKPALALDVGCGTGHSAEALAMFSECVVGLDISAPMLRQARRRKSCAWVQGSAEELPFASETFNIVTVGLAFH